MTIIGKLTESHEVRSLIDRYHRVLKAYNICYYDLNKFDTNELQKTLKSELDEIEKNLTKIVKDSLVWALVQELLRTNDDS